ncbi:unnamed protein product [Penicillium salamii]|uniref:Uncharacterized protein n=1 Tax=Penicillium salamii TaxID=1612424 RepID=A0A9W4JXX5_9EURO|nr:unnamed protein product [Penicillium salamii]CAG8097931.1 unnamed protein product [Penicillium salamii]CAG8297370.1 unnamed protein product [Penicillium salamii]CAG8326236.1 unnamed protein product [Penicillium salamii]CAG8417240.1 unnamed protein product [Penicillium salamii]
MQKKYFWTICAGLACATQDEPANANHIFNAIQSTLRHYETALNPYGMSFHLATAPKGTRFYHGTGTPDPITGVEWLAFKPQHSLGFAHRSGRKQKRSDTQQPLNKAADITTESPGQAGYLHTYAAAKDLRLLYIDGMSAGPGGALEAQDRILFNDTIDSPSLGPRPPVGGPPAEKERAFQTCRMAKEVWGDRIDGVVRTEGDFEILLCSFERDMEVVRITQTKKQDGRGIRTRSESEHSKEKDRRHGKGRGPGSREPRGPVRGDCCSIATKYDQSLGQKVRLDFDHFVSAFGYGLDLFPDGSSRPVLHHIPTELLEPVRRDINSMVNTLEPSLDSFNWQAIADMIVFRYSEELKILAAGDFNSVESIRGRIEAVLEPFIDYREFGAREDIVELCQNEFIPASAPTKSVGGRVISSVSRTVCSTLVSGLLDGEDLNDTVESFKHLLKYLNWTTWKAE